MTATTKRPSGRASSSRSQPTGPTEGHSPPAAGGLPSSPGATGTPAAGVALPGRSPLDTASGGAAASSSGSVGGAGGRRGGCPAHGRTTVRNAVVHTKGCPARPCCTTECHPRLWSYCTICDWRGLPGIKDTGTAPARLAWLARVGLALRRTWAATSLDVAEVARRAGLGYDKVHSLLRLYAGAMSGERVDRIALVLGHAGRLESPPLDGRTAHALARRRAAAAPAVTKPAAVPTSYMPCPAAPVPSPAPAVEALGVAATHPPKPPRTSEADCPTCGQERRKVRVHRGICKAQEDCACTAYDWVCYGCLVAKAPAVKGRPQVVDSLAVARERGARGSQRSHALDRGVEKIGGGR